jgi:hypothetical protein
MKTNHSKARVFTPTAVVALVVLVGVCSMQIRAEDWIESAAKRIEAAIDDEKNNAPLAKAILDQTHPTGKNPVIASVETSRGINGNSLSVAIKLNWNGGFSNANYTTVITWKCNHYKHISATVTSDNAAIGVSEANRLRLNTYFQETFDLWFPAERK